jgi:SdrD B-like domain
MMRKQLSHICFTNYFTILFYLGLLFAPSVLSAQISGTVFRDFNANGIRDNATGMPPITEPFAEGITVTAYLVNNTTVSTTTDVNGDYTFTAIQVPSGQAVRLEFTGIPTSYTDGFSGVTGSTSGTSVRFLTAGTSATNVNLGINTGSEYCQDNPPVAAPCYPLGVGLPTKDLIVTYKYAATGQTSATNNVMLKSPESTTGTLWGTAYNKQNADLYSAAFMKRHSAFGSDSTGNIFVTHNANAAANSATEVFINLNGLTVLNKTTNTNITISTGANPHNTADYLKDEIHSGLNPSDAVGKISFGDMDISEDAKFLYVVNLTDGRLYRIAVDADNNPATKPTAADVVAYNLPNPNCSNGQPRPFGLGFHPTTGHLFIGLVCDGGNSGTLADLKAFVYEMNTLTETFSATPVVTVPLNYKRGDLNDNCEVSTMWNVWITNLTSTNVLSCGIRVYPQPILSDIVFDNIDGAMILGFTDRFSHQTLPSGAHYSDGTGNFSPRVGGDILRVCNIGTLANPIYSLESGGKCGTNGSGSTQPNATTGVTEFYGGEFYNPYHYETALGGLAIMPGTGEVMTSELDPFAVFSNGALRLSNTTGNRTDAYEIIPQGALFQKGASIGDLEMLCAHSPIEIGNRVWVDTNRDGIQNPNERPLSNIVLSLWKSGVKIASTTTNSTGEYYFSSKSNLATPTNWIGTNADTTLLSLTTYEIRLDTTNQAQLDTLKLTTANATANNGNDLIDSDASIVGNYAVITVTTAAAGINNHTEDFGFSPTCDTTLTVVNTTTCNGTTVNLFALASGVKGTLTYSTDGTTWAALANPTNVTPSVSTTYFIKDTLTFGCFDIDTLTITVNQPVTAGVGTNPAAATCQAGSGLANINLAAQITGATVGGTWSQTSGTAVGTALNTTTGVFNPNGIAVGTYTFRYTVVGTSPCPNDTEDIMITIENCCPPSICIPVTVIRN